MDNDFYTCANIRELKIDTDVMLYGEQSGRPIATDFAGRSIASKAYPTTVTTPL